MKSATTIKGYVVLDAGNPKVVLCTDGEYHARGIQTGVGGWTVKIYKSAKQASKFNPGQIVEPITQ